MIVLNINTIVIYIAYTLLAEYMVIYTNHANEVYWNNIRFKYNKYIALSSFFIITKVY
jgi:hypothetical protein